MEEELEKLLNLVVHPDLGLDEIKSFVMPRQCDEKRLLSFPSYSSSYKYVPKRDYLTGNFINFVEVEVDNVGASAKNSMSLRREPGLPEEITKGSHMYYPFWPGGFDEPESDENDNNDTKAKFDDDLLDIPPGFEKGHIFNSNEKFNDVASSPTFEDFEDNINLLNSLESDSDVQEWLNLVQPEKNDAIVKESSLVIEKSELDSELLIGTTPPPVLNISAATNSANFRSEWAEMLDTSKPVDDFHERLPSPAISFPFELDVFQKQAILKLEERQYVFVAAHTSAGKTVVAEYAIGLSQRDLTRAVYTSPIKALSNQKYRDFKTTFKNVGLITGDLQIDPQESILIMTTEILRSMLYCGSDITRDLEYVIFDEVHYINNPERGHVWEEVIILLPDHVNIIMLSATVPNTMELADWVGSTKKRKVFVISTQKRPVPLKHYLYTGSGDKGKNDIYLLVDENGKFLPTNYENAVRKKEESEKSSKTQSKVKNYVSQKQDKKMWIGLIDFLKQNNKMPVVAFTLSRNRCDFNSQALQSVNLNTFEERESVRSFFQQCLNKLKPPDRVLPQVLTMKSSLERGIGVHHSGILPILKEIVEMLFQSGLVKLLFATETFAMGVNMPARTVVFDSHRKFDGMEVRNLKPGEFIQMAGRAGRRGHDENGTVIMLCRPKVPPSRDLVAMILGQPEKLKSQFIIRYAVILTCLRIEKIKVEDIMQFTFLEFNAKLKLPAHREQLKKAEEKYSQLPKLPEHLAPLCKFFDLAYDFITTRGSVIKYVLTSVAKDLKPGRILLVTQGRYYTRLGILLHIKTGNCKETIYRVLVLDDQNSNTKIADTPIIDRNHLFYKMITLSNVCKCFVPEGIGGHTILDCTANDIIEITRSNIKVDGDIIIRNWEQRQIERFKDSPPGASVVKAVSDLYDYTKEYNQNNKKLNHFNMFKNVPLTSQEMTSYVNHAHDIWQELISLYPSLNVPNFVEVFATIFDRKNLENKIEELKFKNSSKNLSLYPDYRSKLAVLRTFNYIDQFDEVTLKGKVACEIGQNELLITELILCNTFNDLEPAEIAALLSGLVFRAKVQGEPVIPEKLVEIVENIKNIDEGILAEELRQHAAIETDSRLNFGLVEVVYEWARNKPFAEIMKLTEVQEGIIVRCIQQLDETLRDVKTAAKRIGNPTLENKMEEASNAIKRDIVFTASLYTTF